jgi:hypothetical protein
MQVLLSFVRNEVFCRCKIEHEERDLLMKINAALVWNAQRVFFEQERQLRSDVRDLEHQALVYLYMDRVSAYQRAAYSWFVSVVHQIENFESLLRDEIVRRKNILWPAMLHKLCVRKLIRVIREEEKIRVKMTDEAETKLKNIGSQFWRVERKKW